MKVIGYENNNRVTAKQRLQSDEDFRLCAPLEMLMNILLVDKPLWSFVVEQPYMGNKATDITIVQDDEELGTVQWAWAGGEHKYRVENDRINNERERGRGYTTKDVSKAVLKIKKMFNALSVREKVEKAAEKAEGEMTGRVGRHNREYLNLKNLVERQMVSYVNDHAWAAFVNHLRENDQTTFNTVQKRDEVYEEVQYMQKLGQDTAGGKTLLVLREGARYIVKSVEGGNEKVNIYDDNDLPEFMKPKLGLLKLVEDKSYVTNTGFRVDSVTFIVEGEKDGQV